MFTFRRVRFNKEVVEHHETGWTEREFRNARIGQWIFLAADRQRFRRRIEEFDSNFAYIFTDIHREHINDLIEQFTINALIGDMNGLNLNKV